MIYDNNFLLRIPMRFGQSHDISQSLVSKTNPSFVRDPPVKIIFRLIIIINGLKISYHFVKKWQV